MTPPRLSSEFLQYLATRVNGDSQSNQLPSLSELGEQLGISVARLREQLEVAKALGFVEVRPRTGMRRLPYSFLPAVRQSLAYAMAVDIENFAIFSDLRNHIEAAYWEQAVLALTEQDIQELISLVENAWKKLRGPHIQIPHEEHRRLHTGIFRRLNNPFVCGLLEAYWEAYEAVGLSMYADYAYLKQVWEYHQRMVDSICKQDYEAGYQALVEHKDLLFHRAVTHLSADGKATNS